MPFIIKKVIAGFLCAFILTAALAQNTGKVIEQNSIKSAILQKDVRYTVYLPADYSTSERSYPVVYLLHGITDDNTGWLQFGEINRYADKAIADGTIPPMIIIMPDGDSSWYINSYDGKEKYEDFFIKEFIPSVEKLYRIKSEKRYRGIAGLSMGGYGALSFSFKYPDLFAAASALSAGIYSNDEWVNMPGNEWVYMKLGPVYGGSLKGKERLNKTWYNNSILKIAETRSADSMKKVRYWIDCGDKDIFTIGNCLLHIILTERKVPHEFRVRDGVHSWSYWRSGITNALQFIGQSFHQQ